VPTAIDQLWVADITYVRLDEAFAYLAIILDAFSRRVIGWALRDHLRAELALEALDQALASRTIIAGCLVHHSDSQCLSASRAGRPDPHSDGPGSVAVAARRLVAV
jgi:putative transposase